MIPFWRGGSIIERYALGYSHPNMAQASLTVIIVLALYLYNKKMHIWQYLAFGLLSYLGIYSYLLKNWTFDCMDLYTDPDAVQK